MAAAWQQDERGIALLNATRACDVNEMQRQLNNGACVDFVFGAKQGTNSATPLIMASGYGHAPAVTVLLENGADVNKEGGLGMGPLTAAVQEGHANVVEILMSHGARHDLKDINGCTPLYQAAENGCKEAAICLLDHGAEVNMTDNKGNTPLIVATSFKHLSLVDLFLSRGADPSFTSKDFSISERGFVAPGQTALHIASGKGFFEIVEHLLDGGAQVDQVDMIGGSPLHCAVQEGHTKVVKLLVKRGAKITLADHYGLTPLYIATLRARHDIVDYLITQGACFDDRGNPVAKVCKGCSATDVPLLKCSGCGIVWYCGPECQKKDWREGGANKHKIQCVRIKEQREMYMAKKKKEVKEMVDEISGTACIIQTSDLVDDKSK